jgi:site-specific recombinase XerD
MDTLVLMDPILPAMTNPVDRFLAGKLSVQTRRAYSNDLRDFFGKMGIRNPWEVSIHQVTAYRNLIMKFDEENNELLNGSTVARRLSAIRSFYDYARALGAVEKNPADAKLVKSPKVSDEGVTKGLTCGEVRRLLEQPDRDTVRGKRDYGIMMLMAHSGMRRSEVAGLKIRHFGEDRGHRILQFRGKGQKLRKLPIKPEAYQAIEEYKEASGRDFSSPDTPIFAPTTNNRMKNLEKPLSTTSIWNIVKNYAGQVGISGISPHSFRVFAITNALSNGATYQQVKMMSGHSDPKTVARYDRGKDNLDRNAVYWIRI